jgi:hypothetical protein
MTQDTYYSIHVYRDLCHFLWWLLSTLCHRYCCLDYTGDRRGRDRMVVGFTTTYAISVLMVFKATFNNISVISWWLVLLVEEPRVLGENHWPVTSHWQTLSHNVLLSTPRLSKVFNVKYCIHYLNLILLVWSRGHCGCDRMVVGFETTYAISTYHH